MKYLFLLALLATGISHASPVSPCAEDMQRFCPQAKSPVEKKQCVRVNHTKFSPTCKSAIQEQMKQKNPECVRSGTLDFKCVIKKYRHNK